MQSEGNNATQPAQEHSADEEIRQIAYYLWLNDGCPDGQHHEHWLKAEELWHAQPTAAAPDNPKPARARKQAAPKQQPAKTTRRRLQPVT